MLFGYDYNDMRCSVFFVCASFSFLSFVCVYACGGWGGGGVKIKMLMTYCSCSGHTFDTCPSF